MGRSDPPLQATVNPSTGKAEPTEPASGDGIEPGVPVSRVAGVPAASEPEQTNDRREDVAPPDEPDEMGEPRCIAAAAPEPGWATETRETAAEPLAPGEAHRDIEAAPEPEPMGEQQEAEEARDLVEATAPQPESASSEPESVSQALEVVPEPLQPVSEHRETASEAPSSELPEAAASAWPDQASEPREVGEAWYQPDQQTPAPESAVTAFEPAPVPEPPAAAAALPQPDWLSDHRYPAPAWPQPGHASAPRDAAPAWFERQPAHVPREALAAPFAVAVPGDAPHRWDIDEVKAIGVRAAKVAAIVFSAWFSVVLFLIVIYRFVNPPFSSLMVLQWLSGTSIQQEWVPLERISPNLRRAVIVSEDGRFCQHWGIDFAEVAAAIERTSNGVPRGASTITMQVAKNLFLWPAKSYVRKLVEVPLTYAIELMWPKRRILEIYLNIAEWGPGIFGAEAAARAHFGHSASGLGARQSAQLAVSLPNPLIRDAGDPGPRTSRRASVIQRRAAGMRSASSCVDTNG